MHLTPKQNILIQTCQSTFKGPDNFIKLTYLNYHINLHKNALNDFLSQNQARRDTPGIKTHTQLQQFSRVIQ